MLKNVVILFCCLILMIFFPACGNNKSSANKAPDIKKGVMPIADSEVAVIEMEQSVYGKITLELYSNIAPEMVKRFKELAKEGFYNGVTFHRINQAVIQGGDPLSKDNIPENDGSGNSPKPNIPAEFSDLPFDIGTLGAARLGGDVNTQNCQFFITLKRTAEFDKNYTVFGKVIDGMNNVRTIAGAPRDRERPLDDIKIKTITIQSK